jgi:hypothetical protein
MTVKTFWFNGATGAVAPGWFGLILDGVAPPVAAPLFGWRPGGATPNTGYFKSFFGGTNFSQTAQASSYIDATTGPTKGSDAATNGGDSFITPAPLTGAFAAGNWNFLFWLQLAGGGANTSGGLMRCRVWASVNADGSAARLLTPSTLVTQTLTGLTPSTPQGGPQFTVTWGAPAITLNNEYLFFQIEPNVTTISGTTATWGVRGSGANVVTPDFQPPSAGGLVGIMG